jgi:hypothetical protein
MWTEDHSPCIAAAATAATYRRIMDSNLDRSQDIPRSYVYVKVCRMKSDAKFPMSLSLVPACLCYAKPAGITAYGTSIW